MSLAAPSTAMHAPSTVDSASGPDTGLLALFAEFSKALHASREANARADAAFQAAKAARPTLPDALRRKGDLHLFLGRACNPASPEHYTRAECIEFRACVPRVYGSKRQNDLRQARAAEIVAASEQYEAAIRQHEEAHGLPAADVQADVLHEALCVIADAIMAIPATTLAGFSAKARVALAVRHDKRIEQLLAELAAVGGEA